MINLNQKILDKKINLSINPLILQYELDENVSEENVQTFQKYRQAAKQGQIEAQYKLGLMYLYGQIVPQDDALAVHWLRRAAQQGQEKAQTKLGLLYKGAPDAQANALATQWSAAQPGHAKSQHNLDLLHKVGKDTSQKDSESIPMTDRRLFLLLGAIGLTSSYLLLSRCADNYSVSIGRGGSS
jgi:hypothetical protein